MVANALAFQNIRKNNIKIKIKKYYGIIYNA
jgi:hypothetical protein